MTTFDLTTWRFICDLERRFFNGVIETNAWLEMIQEGCEDELETANIDRSFKEFCCNREKRNRTEAGEGCGVNGGLYLVDIAACREEEIIDARYK